ncbi:MAG: hypothetical protein ABJ233_08520 [Erythrobacter sp.]
MADISSGDSRLDGKVVAIHGWLGECGGLNCAIYPSLEDARLVAGGPDTDEWYAAMDRGLAIGGEIEFDLIAGPMQFSEVVVYGEVNDSWRKPPDENGTKYGCLDRCDDIKPRSIRLILN